ncbi:MAG: hypothetical protein N2545_10990, partial [Thermoflexales bacterium]|nr:hypothetical protein [Thermoflexales bacterium]
DDYVQCVALQQAVWSGDLAVPAQMMLALTRHGGVALGAFTPEGRMIGFVLSFLGWSAQGVLCHHSHMAAVAEGWRDRGVGTALKRAQREAVLAQGVCLITWTYDPLEARNAHLNIAKLGCICRTYIRNAYGEMPDALNAGLPSDRFEVEWWLEERPVFQPPTRMIAIPRDFQALKRADLSAALAWRLQTREQFERAFAEGYVVVGFETRDDLGVYHLALPLSVSERNASTA